MPSSTRRPRSEARLLDQFYTCPEVARTLAARALDAFGPLPPDVLFLEPAAGRGAFLDALPRPRLGLDVAPPPDRPDIERADFLSWTPPVRPVVVVTNPPFGRNSSLAVRFLNRAAGFALFVAAVVPRTFSKETVARRLDPRLRPLGEWAMDPLSFLHEGRPRAVPCTFRAWSVEAAPAARPRAAPAPLVHPHFSFVRDPALAHFAFRRVGARAGHVSVEGLSMSPQSHLFVRASDGVDPREVMARMSALDWSEARASTAGVPSIGRGEIVRAYERG